MYPPVHGRLIDDAFWRYSNLEQAEKIVRCSARRALWRRCFQHVTRKPCFFRERTAQSMTSKNGGLTLREQEAIYKKQAQRRPTCTQHRKSLALASPASRHPALAQHLR